MYFCVSPNGKQNHICVSCGRQFIDSYEYQGYSAEVKKECLEMYVNGLGFRAIERVKKVQMLADSLTLRYHNYCNKLGKRAWKDVTRFT